MSQNEKRYMSWINQYTISRLSAPIGPDWTAQFLARGFDVITTDPVSNTESKLHESIDAAWKALTVIGLSAGATRDRLTFTSNVNGGSR